MHRGSSDRDRRQWTASPDTHRLTVLRAGDGPEVGGNEGPTSSLDVRRTWRRGTVPVELGVDYDTEGEVSGGGVGCEKDRWTGMCQLLEELCDQRITLPLSGHVLPAAPRFLSFPFHLSLFFRTPLPRCAPPSSLGSRPPPATTRRPVSGRSA